jgi:hypothetical protein
MRAAQISNNTVINYAEVVAFDDVQFIDPTGSVMGSTWNGATFTAPIPDPPTFPELETAIQSQLDTYAQSWGYADCARACTFVGSTVAKFNNEGTALRNWRDQTWAAAETLAGQIESGTAQMPETIEAALALMPVAPTRPS